MKQSIKYLACMLSSMILATQENFSVDFEQAMGKNDAYMHKYYQHFLEQLNNNDSFDCLKPYTAFDLLNLCKHTYDAGKNCQRGIVTKSKGSGIPQIFHQIWIGKKPFPEKYKRWQKAWQSVPGWEYRLWTDADVEKLELFNKDVFYQEKNLGSRADILRIEILYRFGGVYIDTDFELLNPEFFNFANKTYDFYCGLTPIDSFFHWNFFVLNNAIIGSIPGHPILWSYIENRRAIDPKMLIVAKGPAFFTKMVLMSANKGHNDVIFPPTYFYPVGNMQMHAKEYAHITNPLEKLETLKKDCLRPESVAVHWWDGSWTLPDAWVK